MLTLLTHRCVNLVKCTLLAAILSEDSQFTPDIMASFKSLPLELRSTILDDWLDDTLQRQREVSAGPCRDEQRPWRLNLDSHSRLRAKIDKANTCRHNAAAIEIRRLINAFSAEDRLELKSRLLKVHLQRATEEGLRVCGQIEGLRAEMLKSPRLKIYQRSSIIKRWEQYLQAVNVVEWSCHIIQKTMGTPENRWIAFRFHRLLCGQGTGVCECQGMRRGSPKYAVSHKGGFHI